MQFHTFICPLGGYKFLRNIALALLYGFVVACGGGSGSSETNFSLANITAEVDVPENSTYVSVTPSLTGDAPIGQVSYSLSGDDASLFTINSATGVVSMIGRNYEAPSDQGEDNVYQYTLVAADAYGNTASADVKVTVTDYGIWSQAGLHIISYNSSMIVINGNQQEASAALYFGAYLTNDHNLSGQLQPYSTSGAKIGVTPYFLNAQIAGHSLNGTAVRQSETLAINALYLDESNRAASFSSVSGNWEYGKYFFNISGSGELVGSSTDGCGFSGLLTYADVKAEISIYKLELDVTGCDLQGDYSGMASLIDNTVENDGLIIGFANDSHGLGFALSRSSSQVMFVEGI